MICLCLKIQINLTLRLKPWPSILASTPSIFNLCYSFPSTCKIFWKNRVAAFLPSLLAVQLFFLTLSPALPRSLLTCSRSSKSLCLIVQRFSTWLTCGTSTCRLWKVTNQPPGRRLGSDSLAIAVPRQVSVWLHLTNLLTEFTHLYHSKPVITKCHVLSQVAGVSRSRCGFSSRKAQEGPTHSGHQAMGYSRTDSRFK